MVDLDSFSDLHNLSHMDNNQLITFLGFLVLILFFICLVMVCTQFCKSMYRMDPSYLLSDENPRPSAKEVIHERTPSKVKIVVAPMGQLYYANICSSQSYPRMDLSQDSKGYVPLYEEVISLESNSFLSRSQGMQSCGQGTSVLAQHIEDLQSGGLLKDQQSERN
eukprot:TRINITY_DN2862_c0_g1_i10.p3 TRINITY_DN2862_c0_g1~~TRINITY_DN2862_c0_g1_i10.p3  ORF type:complete len:165 (-),score=8.81 TRINITY_DN2862_c0_g1_i10:893-1387(-)